MSDHTSPEETPADENATAPTAQAPAVETPAPATETAAAEPAPEAATASAPEPAAEPTSAEAPAPEPAAEPTSAEAPAPEPAAEPTSAEAPAPEPAAEPTSAKAPAAEPAADPTPAMEAPADASAPVAPVAAPAEAPAAGGADAAPAEDPAAGLGLPEAGAILGPPNLGGFESGEIVSGTVLTVNKREAEVDLGNGKIGVIGDRHWTSGGQVDLTTVVKTGDTVDGAVLARADIKKRITLSHTWAAQKRGWEAAESAAKDRGELTGTVTETVKGGLSLDINGVRAFMPASLVDLQTVNDLKPFIGQTVTVRVIEADRNKARLIVSRKAALRAVQRQEARSAMANFEVGQTHTGTVAQITDFGAFVDVQGVRGLVHKSEIGWSRARDPQRDLQVGQEVEVKVLKVQPSKNRLGLSMRMGDDPMKSLKKGDRFEGAITRLVDFGAFVELPGGGEGLVHVSEMAEHRVFAPEEVVMPGDKVWVKVLKTDRKRRTIDLSIARAAVPDSPEEIAAREAAAAKAEEDAASAEASQPAAEADESTDTGAPSDDTGTESSGDAAPAAAVDDDHAEDQAGEAAASTDDAEE